MEQFLIFLFGFSIGLLVAVSVNRTQKRGDKLPPKTDPPGTRKVNLKYTSYECSLREHNNSCPLCGKVN